MSTPKVWLKEGCYHTNTAAATEDSADILGSSGAAAAWRTVARHGGWLSSPSVRPPFKKIFGLENNNSNISLIICSFYWQGGRFYYNIQIVYLHKYILGNYFIEIIIIMIIILIIKNFRNLEMIKYFTIANQLIKLITFTRTKTTNTSAIGVRTWGLVLKQDFSESISISQVSISIWISSFILFPFSVNYMCIPDDMKDFQLYLLRNIFKQTNILLK